MTNSLYDVAKVFLKLGFTAFGGPAAHIAMMQEEVVTKRKWLTEPEFLDLIGATNLIPGPNSTEMAIHIGKKRAGWQGLIMAGACFILPSVFITGIFAWLYKHYGHLPDMQPYIYGIKPAIIAIILSAVYPLAIRSLKSISFVIIGLVVLIGSLLRISEVYLMFGAGFVAVIFSDITSGTTDRFRTKILFPMLQIPGIIMTTVSNMKLFLIFIKIGSILYGSGYVLFAFLDTELVSTGLLSRQTLVDAIAVGQFTPGPVFSSVTFIGYQMNGWPGALVATLGIFLPAFVFVAMLGPLLKKLRSSARLSIFLDAVNVASVAIILSVCISMGQEIITDWRTLWIGLIGLCITFGYRNLNSALVVLGGSVLGYFLMLI
jgi:chromate transporter